MDDKISYTEAFDELQEIVTDMEDSKISIDDLDIKIKRASELLKICKNKLYKTEENVQNILNEINDFSIDN